MDPLTIMTNENVLAWITRMDPLCPTLAVRLKWMALLLCKGVVRFESFCETLTLYCGVRDWMELPCPDLEHWLRSNVLPLDARFSRSLDPFPRPQTILDDSSVQRWFEMAKNVDESYCSELKAIILRRSLGIEAKSPLSKWIGVTFDAASIAISMPCEVLEKWLEENSDKEGRGAWQRAQGYATLKTQMRP